MNEYTNNCPICLKIHPEPHRKNGWIGVDFDGTLAINVFNRDNPYTLGQPIPKMIERVRVWLDMGYTVKIMTARMANWSHTANAIRDLEKMERLLKDWSKEHIGEELECTAQKDGLMIALWDDRAIGVIENTGEIA